MRALAEGGVPVIKAIESATEAAGNLLEKCDNWEPERPFGNAQSFTDVDAYSRADQQRNAIWQLTDQFTSIVYNIMADTELELGAKADRVEAAAQELRGRIGRDSAVQAEPGMLKSLGRLFRKGPPESVTPPPAGTAPSVNSTADVLPSGSFRVQKDASGRLRWFGVWSNHYRDKEGDIFTSKAHREYEEYIDAGGDMPELWLWHVKGSRVGQADMVAFADGFQTASGLFDKEMEHVAPALVALDLAMSHGSWVQDSDYRKENGVGVIERYRTREISVLPRKAAANPITFFVNEEDEPMPLTKEKREFLDKTVGPEFADRLGTLLKEASDAAERQGLVYKEFAKEVAEAVVEGLAPQPADAPPATPPVAADNGAVLGAIQQLAASVQTLSESLGMVQKSLTEQQATIDVIKQTDDQRIAALLTPRNDPRVGGYTGNSTAAGTVDETDPRVVAMKKEQGGGTPDHLAPYLNSLKALSGVGA